MDPELEIPNAETWTMDLKVDRYPFHYFANTFLLNSQEINREIAVGLCVIA